MSNLDVVRKEGVDESGIDSIFVAELYRGARILVLGAYVVVFSS